MISGLPVQSSLKNKFRISLLAGMVGISSASAEEIKLPFDVKIVSSTSEIANGYYYRGYEKMQKKDYISALMAFNNALDFNPAMTEALILRAWTKQKLSMLDASILDFNLALTYSESNSGAMLGKAVVLFQKEKFSECIASLKAIIEADPAHPEAYLFLGAARIKLGQVKFAISEVDTYISQNPKNPGAFFARGLVKYKNRDISNAIADLEKAKELGFEYNSEVMDFLNG